MAKQTRNIITDYDAYSDVQILAGREIHNWKRIMDEIRSGHDITALVGGIAGLERNPPPDALASMTFNATEACPWTVATYTPIDANPQGPKQYEFFAAGTMTTTATASPTCTLTPRFGTAVGGAPLGASSSIVLTASQTAVPWQIRGDLSIRGTGTGTNARIKATFTVIGKFAAPANGLVDSHGIFGYTAATGDSSAASGLWMGWSSAVTTSSVIVEQLRWGSWN